MPAFCCRQRLLQRTIPRPLRNRCSVQTPRAKSMKWGSCFTCLSPVRLRCVARCNRPNVSCRNSGGRDAAPPRHRSETETAPSADTPPERTTASRFRPRRHCSASFISSSRSSGWSVRRRSSRDHATVGRALGPDRIRAGSPCSSGPRCLCSGWTFGFFVPLAGGVCSRPRKWSRLSCHPLDLGRSSSASRRCTGEHSNCTNDFVIDDAMSRHRPARHGK